MSRSIREPFNGQSGADSPQNLFVPTIIEEIPGGGRVAYDPFSRLLKSNIVWVRDMVEPNMADVITSQLLHLYYDKIKPRLEAATDEKTRVLDLSKVPEKDRTIRIFINSPGGYIDDGLEIYDCMQLLKSEGVIIETNVLGKAMSMGSVILVGGSEGHRYSWPSSHIMLHQAGGGSQGKFLDADVSHEEFQYINERMKAIYRAHTDLTDPEIEKIFDRDYFMRAEEAKKLGIVDNILYPENDPRVKNMLVNENNRHEEFKKTRVRREVPPAP